MRLRVGAAGRLTSDELGDYENDADFYGCTYQQERWWSWPQIRAVPSVLTVCVK